MTNNDRIENSLDAPATDPLAAIGSTPLLTREEEMKLSRQIEEGLNRLRLLALKSPIAVRELLNWNELISRREMSSKELMPRGRRTGREISEMRRKIAEAAGAAQSLKRRSPSVERDRVYDKIIALNLGEKKIRRLVNRIKKLALQLDQAACPGEWSLILRPYAISAGELRALDAEIREAEESIQAVKRKIVSANMRLVLSIAGKYTTHCLELSDLVQEGALGLMRAAEKFDHTRGFKFSTYATWWIRQAIARAIYEKEQTIRIPVHIRERASRIRKVSDGYLWRVGRVPLIEEIARSLRMSAAKVKNTLEAVQPSVSLSHPVGAEEESSLEDILEDTASSSPAAAVESRLRQEEMDKFFSQLSKRESEVLKLRFGLSMDRARTLSELGEKFGLSRERVRQIQVQAIAKLRRSPSSEAMRDYF